MSFWLSLQGVFAELYSFVPCCLHFCGTWKQTCVFSGEVSFPSQICAQERSESVLLKHVEKLRGCSGTHQHKHGRKVDASWCKPLSRHCPHQYFGKDLHAGVVPLIVSLLEFRDWEFRFSLIRIGWFWYVQVDYSAMGYRIQRWIGNRAQHALHYLVSGVSLILPTAKRALKLPCFWISCRHRASYIFWLGSTIVQSPKDEFRQHLKHLWGDRVEGNIILLGEKELLDEVRRTAPFCKRFAWISQPPQFHASGFCRRSARISPTLGLADRWLREINGICSNPWMLFHWNNTCPGRELLSAA